MRSSRGRCRLKDRSRRSSRTANRRSRRVPVVARSVLLEVGWVSGRVLAGRVQDLLLHNRSGLAEEAVVVVGEVVVRDLILRPYGVEPEGGELVQGLVLGKSRAVPLSVDFFDEARHPLGVQAHPRVPERQGVNVHEGRAGPRSGPVACDFKRHLIELVGQEDRGFVQKRGAEACGAGCQNCGAGDPRSRI